MNNFLDGVNVVLSSFQGLHTIADSVNALSNILIKSINDSYSIVAYNHPLPYSTEGQVGYY